MSQQALTFEGRLRKAVRLNYLLYLPPAYDAEPARRWPLIAFLHGRGERGDDLALIKKHGLPRLVEERPDFPFIVVSPQCPLGTYWPHLVDTLEAWLDAVLKQVRADRRRLYLTGLSMGGYGTWFWAMARPDRFAAIAPICGGGDPDYAHVLKDLPIWVFHGAKDTVVRPAESRLMVKALKNAGSAQVRLTIYPDADHDSWTRTYANPELYDWFLAHRR